MLSYAGIGSRKTPDAVKVRMTELAGVLEKDGLILRSGGAEGADTAFEEGVKDPSRKQIFLLENYTSAALEHAEMFHPRWNKLSENGKRLMARNSMIMLGENLNDPVEFVCFWTVNYRIVGGTGQGLRIAEYYDIPTYGVSEDSPNLIRVQHD